MLQNKGVRDMAKAILVMDMPEQTCQKCTLCYEYETEDDGYLCCATGKLLPDGGKPDWCPLRELPKHKRTIGAVDEGKKLLLNAGWNDCLDKILEAKKGD